MNKEDKVANEIFQKPHRRFNPLTGEWILLSPQRTKRPWQGRSEKISQVVSKSYDHSCYLCPGNTRAGNLINPDYKGVFVFENDFSALVENHEIYEQAESDLFKTEPAGGCCRVICFSEKHDVTLAQMEEKNIQMVVRAWVKQNRELGEKYKWIQIFENKGEVMGCSNPHPHGQIWASDFVPEEPLKEDIHQKRYFAGNKRVLLLDYLGEELKRGKRIVAGNDSWVALVPYWAVWPFELMVIPREHTKSLSDLNLSQQEGMANIIKTIGVKYDNIFGTPFPYSMGWHQAPSLSENTKHWQLHAHYYPPLLRSATVKKFMVGFEMLGCPQRDITPESAAKIIRAQSDIHYKDRTAD